MLQTVKMGLSNYQNAFLIFGACLKVMKVFELAKQICLKDIWCIPSLFGKLWIVNVEVTWSSCKFVVFIPQGLAQIDMNWIYIKIKQIPGAYTLCFTPQGSNNYEC